MTQFDVKWKMQPRIQNGTNGVCVCAYLASAAQGFAKKVSNEFMLNDEETLDDKRNGIKSVVASFLASLTVALDAPFAVRIDADNQ